MHSTGLFVLALSAISSALPTITPRNNCKNPSTFTVNGFTTFTPAEGNTEHPAAVFFTISDDRNLGRVSCSRTGDITSKDAATCSDETTVFKWTGGALTVGETYDSCPDLVTVQTFGDIQLSLNCYPSVPPMPNGYGTQCQTPTGQVSGLFSRSQF
ncbi:uncharacterized protein BP5553_06186 [Venustampulla echinocandica]|uniref:AA1-like domain-containing protein n=1 Tax=Venustampulla echinocandica TaxID=2656787 RepID=A0A370TMU0_9HELO|nr:uncharacterized protein BP5553_06186 [Venustampulla echinocandica]RDL36834.1 hypothetical protein BP5553_06186 [Venustampulla echinocandica]